MSARKKKRVAGGGGGGGTRARRVRGADAAAPRKASGGGRRTPRAARAVGHDHPPSAAHDHDHGHHHDHDHDHPHDHGHGRRRAQGSARHGAARLREDALSAESHRAPLPEGAGRGKILYLDAASGIAGDMTIAALVDLGVPFDVVERGVSALGMRGVEARLSPGMAGAIGAARFEVHAGGAQPERRWGEIDALISRARLSSRVKQLARAIFRRLGEAEARVHRIPIEDVHFHEVGAVDAIVDIVGAAACVEHLGATVVASPMPIGRGFVNCRHGVLPLPAPAALVCLEGVPTIDAGIDAELVTPTGAAIVATVASGFAAWPAMVVERVGWGAGAAVLPDRPNALRAVLGAPTGEVPAAAPGVATHVVLEANVDDLTGELAGHAIEALLAAGALDAWAVPSTMKKGRPGLVLCALATQAQVQRVADCLLRETSSIGVRMTPASRIERPRRMIEVETPWGPVPVKVSAGPWGPPVSKPEFDACAAVAARAGVPVRAVLAAALEAAHAAVRGGPVR